ncbi:MAG TPA: hypothetical protein VGJ73_18900 [Verrucomicrobiae bacterium]
MKTRLITVSRLLLFSSVFLFVVEASHSAVPSQASTLPVSTDYVCVQRGPHSKIWRRAVIETNQSGIVRTNLHSYTELATGLCYLENGQYVDSVEQIDPVADGAQAIHGRHQVHWAANANTPDGAVTLTTPDGKTLRSTVFGLAYYDTASGSNVMITQLQDSTATITSPNTLVYMNAFSNLAADIRYIYKKSGMSQDIILRQNPPSPAEYGLNPATTRLEVVTEFFDPPPPTKLTVTNNHLTNDCRLGFGDMSMSVGHAFMFEGDGTMKGGGSVIKEWTHFENQTFLIEEVPFTSVSNLLSSLHSSLIKPDKSRVRRTVQLENPKPRKISAVPMPQPARKVKELPREKALVVDYDLLSSANNFTFQGDTTYLVSDLCDFSGTVTLEGGAVIKYTNNSTAQIQATNFQCLTAPYRPAVFTSMNDDSVGDSISGSTGNPWGDNAGEAALYCYGEGFFYGTNGGNADLQGLRFSHLAACVSLQDSIDDGGGSLTMNDFQVVDCRQVVESTGAECYLFNGLAYDVSNLFGTYAGRGNADGQNLIAVNLTVHHCSHYALDQTSLMFFTNCLFADVSNIYTLPDYTVIASSYFLTNDAGVFQTVGAASHYLADNSTNRGAGTTNIDPDLLADLAAKSTYPPVVITNIWATNDYTFFPQAQRDNIGSAVDLGYHYDPLDYAVTMVISNATIKVLPGTVLTQGGEYGVVAEMMSHGTFISHGTATAPNYLVPYNTVQEQSNTNWEDAGSTYLMVMEPSNLDPETMSFRFTKFVGTAANTTLFVENYGSTNAVDVQDCQFYGGSISWQQPSMFCTNNLFWRVNTFMAENTAPITINLYNNLFWQGEFEYEHYSSGAWVFRDNLFDQCSVFTEPWNNPVDICSNNAYVTTNFGIAAPENDDQILTTSPDYETGALGDFYYPSTETQLIHKGSSSAPDAGLYHYTVTTNNAIEGTNIVSIGFHYVATDTNGIPFDANGDGIPDYLEDSNGNGLVDSGEIAWNTNDLGLFVVITQPASNSKIP